MVGEELQVEMKAKDFKIHKETIRQNLKFKNYN